MKYKTASVQTPIFSATSLTHNLFSKYRLFTRLSLSLEIAAFGAIYYIILSPRTIAIAPIDKKAGVFVY
jgi:hypothetical protein